MTSDRDDRQLVARLYVGFGSVSPTRPPNFEGGLLTFKMSVMAAAVHFLQSRPQAAARLSRRKRSPRCFGADRTVDAQLGVVIPAGLGEVKLTFVHADQTGAAAFAIAGGSGVSGILLPATSSAARKSIGFGAGLWHNF